MDQALIERIDHAQLNEITEAQIYKNIAATLPKDNDREIMLRIAADEERHAKVWAGYSGNTKTPKKFIVWWYTFISKVFGYTFAIKLMEMGEEGAQQNYVEIVQALPDTRRILEDEQRHEEELVEMLDEERLRYAGSVVLGLNDALVELTGALAGLTLALHTKPELIALSGLVTGIAASLSMGASEYLSTSQESDGKHPLRAAIYTGLAYIFTVAALITPYLVIKAPFISLAISLTTAVLIIAIFNYYISVAKGESFKHRFLEMSILSLSVAAFSFVIGYFIRLWLGVEI